MGKLTITSLLVFSRAISNKDADRGILICGTGVGMSIVAIREQGLEQFWHIIS